jgi:hypothetical protein
MSSAGPREAQIRRGDVKPAGKGLVETLLVTPYTLAWGRTDHEFRIHTQILIIFLPSVG